MRSNIVNILLLLLLSMLPITEARGWSGGLGRAGGWGRRGMGMGRGWGRRGFNFPGRGMVFGRGFWG
ncbi:unnamed protein product [Bursaphelenchus xylophilus]|uniref:(pine wood nematode) hypothetical protein n=1 Tax=Bursaphelenchus xylophilus TaxID=6326 RepID=A0A1I7RVJ3_BURXY|nr:unnamed protein product [Bursaphelenchus xylophilus]CAG9081761.1 unnamed protein product [Bursaphelenchus xylophilus]